MFEDHIDRARERRRAQRIPSPGLCAAPATVTIDNHPWRVDDVSHSGMGLTTAGSALPRSSMLLNVYDGDTLLLGSVTARVVHASGQRAGLILEDLDPVQQTALDLTLKELAHAGAVDREAIIQRFQGRSPFLRRMVRLFSGDVLEKLASLDKALANGDTRLATLTAHSLAGAAATMAAPRMRALCLELENLLGSLHSAEAGRQLLAGINREAAAVMAELDELAGPPVEQVSPGAHRPVSEA